MGWAEFGQALFLNASNAAGTLAETKLALRQEERADRQLLLQEQSHKATVEYQKAKLAFDEWATTQEAGFREEEMAYKMEALEWSKGSHERAIALETQKAQNRIAEGAIKHEREEKAKKLAIEEAEKRKELLITERTNRLMASLPELEEGIARGIVEEDITGKAAVDALSRAQWLEDYKLRNPDASETEAIAAWQEENKTPTTQTELDKMKAIAAYREEVQTDFAEDRIDKDEHDFLMKMIDKMTHGAGGADARSSHDKYFDAVDKAVTDGILTEDEGKKRKRDYLMKQASGSSGADGDYSPVDTINKYGAFTDSGQLMSSVYLGSGTNDEKERNLRTLDMYLRGAKNIEDIEKGKESDTARMVSHVIVDKLSKIRKEAVNRFDASVIFTLQGAPRLWEEYQRLKANGHDMGKLLRIRQGVVQAIGETVHPDVTNFATHLGEFMETRLRLRTGAVINDEEIATEMARQPNPFVDQDVSEGAMLGLLEFSYNYQRALYKSVAGEKWADFIMGQTQSETKELIDELAEKVQRPANMSAEEQQEEDSWWGRNVGGAKE